jgi:hypothetical protein
VGAALCRTVRRDGTITLRFMGRTEIPGIVLGCQLRVEGTPWVEDGTLIMVNPLYEFET